MAVSIGKPRNKHFWKCGTSSRTFCPTANPFRAVSFTALPFADLDRGRQQVDCGRHDRKQYQLWLSIHSGQPERPEIRRVGDRWLYRLGNHGTSTSGNAGQAQGRSAQPLTPSGPCPSRPFPSLIAPSTNRVFCRTKGKGGKTGLSSLLSQSSLLQGARSMMKLKDALIQPGQLGSELDHLTNDNERGRSDLLLFQHQRHLL